MSVVILGGNECMVRRYEELCKSYDCKAKVYAKMERGMQNIGSPDLLVLFTGTMSHKMLELASTQAKKRNINIVRTDTISHKMVQNALNETRGQDTVIIRSRSSSMSALGSILETHAEAARV